jgi:hypothetical protein
LNFYWSFSKENSNVAEKYKNDDERVIDRCDFGINYWKSAKRGIEVEIVVI